MARTRSNVHEANRAALDAGTTDLWQNSTIPDFLYSLSDDELRDALTWDRGSQFRQMATYVARVRGVHPTLPKIEIRDYGDEY